MTILDKYRELMEEPDEIKVHIPEGYEVDREKSTSTEISFKKKQDITFYDIWESCDHPATVMTTIKLQPKLLAINQLILTADYLNKGWEPDWKDPQEDKFSIYVDQDDKIIVAFCYSSTDSVTVFKTEKLARRAISILGEETIKTALK